MMKRNGLQIIAGDVVIVMNGLERMISIAVIVEQSVEKGSSGHIRT